MKPIFSSEHRVLVTGSTGFVGIPLCTRLQKDQYIVRGCVRRAEFQSKLPDGMQAPLIESIDPDTDWSNALSGVNTVIHLAARVHIMNDKSADPLTAYRLVNVEGTENLALQAAANGVQRLIFLSTVKVHGEETAVPYTEQNLPAPQDPYGISKLEAEVVLRKIAVKYGLEVVILRPPLVYGPGVKANFLQLFRMVTLGVPLPLASITNLRSLVYLGNLIDAIVACITNKNASGKTFLVSDGFDVSTPELIRQVAIALDCPIRLIPFHPSILRIVGKLAGKTNSVERLLGSLVVDSSKIQRELSWKPPFTLEEGLLITANWFKTQFN